MKRIKTFYELNADKAKNKTVADINTKNKSLNSTTSSLKGEVLEKLNELTYSYNNSKILDLICEYLNISNIDTKIDRYKKIEYIQIVLSNRINGFIHDRINGKFDCFLKGKKVFEGSYREFLIFLKENL